MIRNIYSLTWWLSLFIASIIVIVVSNAAFTIYEVEMSQHRWCTTLEHLTSAPPSPSAKGSQKFYNDFVNLKHQFGCAP